MNPRTDLWLQNLIDERDGAALYEGLARHEKDRERARSFQEIAEAERRHAEVWRKKLEKEGVQIPPDRPSSRVRALIWLAALATSGWLTVGQGPLRRAVHDANLYTWGGLLLLLLLATQLRERQPETG